MVEFRLDKKSGALNDIQSTTFFIFLKDRNYCNQGAAN